MVKAYGLLPAIPDDVAEKTCSPTGPGTSLDGACTRRVGDLYSKLNDDTLFRQEWAERVGLGFQLIHFGTQIELTSETSNVA